MFILVFVLLALTSFTACKSGETPSCAPKVAHNGSYIVSDVAIVAYRDGKKSDCHAAGRRILKSTLWFGFKYGVCSEFRQCGFDCDKLQECASNGYTMDKFNECYNDGFACGVTQTYAVITPPVGSNGGFDLTIAHYNDSLCAGAQISTEMVELDTCMNGFDECGYSTYSYVRINACVDDPDHDAGAILENLFSMF